MVLSKPAGGNPDRAQIESTGSHPLSRPVDFVPIVYGLSVEGAAPAPPAEPASDVPSDAEASSEVRSGCAELALIRCVPGSNTGRSGRSGSS